MRHMVKADMLDAMKNNLQELEDIALLSPDDLDIVNQKRILREQIAKLEKGDSDDYDMAAD